MTPRQIPARRLSRQVRHRKKGVITTFVPSCRTGTPQRGIPTLIEAAMTRFWFCGGLAGKSGCAIF